MIKKALNKIGNQVNFSAQCRRYNLSLWECPQFLFVVMGIFIGAVIIVVYLLGSRYLIDPETLVIALSMITAILLIISFIITQSFERLAEANRMKTELINIISHQIRTPLTNLRWVHDSINSEKSNFTEEQRDNLDTMGGDIKRMIKIASDLLIASRIERGEIDFKKSRYSLEKVVRELIKENNLSVTLNIEEGISEMEGDEMHIKMMIGNLLDNAVKYGGDKIDIEIKKNEKKKIFLKIRDNGSGIPKSDHPKIFQRFFRGNNASKYNTQGMGLSLFISRFIIESEGGSIGFESEEGRGSTFWFYLPVNK